MKKKLCYVTKNSGFLQDLQGFISNNGYAINQVTPSEFMVELWTRKPDVVVVDLDSAGEKGVISIESVLEADYVPTIFVYSKYKPTWHDLVNNGIIISDERCKMVIKDLLKNSEITGNHYTQISVNYETMKMMSEEFDAYLDAYMKALKANESTIIDDFLSLVYSKNYLMQQIPKWFLVVNQEPTGIEVWIYGQNLEEVVNFKIRAMTVQAYIDKASEAGIYVNFSDLALSDVTSIDHLIPDEIIKHFDKEFIGFNKSRVESMTSFAMKKTLYIGMDYSNEVNGYDLAIFKAVCDKIHKLKMVKSNIVDLQASFIYTMDALARAAESKDDVTGHHIKRVNDYSALLARQMGMDDAFVNGIEIAAQMHDVGKISVSELILNKPGKLTDEEFAEMKKHTVYGAEIIGDSYHLSMPREIALYHHEKYDGSGYPEGLVGEAIPMSARIVCLADIYDALRSPRSYKDGFSHQRAFDIINVGDGRVMPDHFDPRVLEAFKEVHEVMKHIYDTHAD